MTKKYGGMNKSKKIKMEVLATNNAQWASIWGKKRIFNMVKNIVKSEKVNKNPTRRIWQSIFFPF